MPRWAAWIVAGLLSLIALSAQAQLPRTQCVSTALAAGTGDAIAIPLLPCTETTTVLILTVSAPNSTTAPTISVNGQTPHVILNFDASALGVGELQAAQRRVLTYDGQHWILLNSGGGGSGSSGPFDIPIFWPGKPPNSAIVNIAITRAVACSGSLPGSVGNAGTAATASAVININHLSGVSSTLVGTATFSASSAVASFVSGGFLLAPGDDIQYAFPASQDASLADVALTLACVRS